MRPMYPPPPPLKVIFFKNVTTGRNFLAEFALKSRGYGGFGKTSGEMNGI